jgi:putative membrane protein
MKNLLIKLMVNALAVFITGWILGDAVQINGILGALAVAVVLALLNLTVKPVLVILTIPATVVTLGLFLLVVNALVVLTADYLLASFQIANFWWALLFSLLLSFINSLLLRLGEKPAA